MNSSQTPGVKAGFPLVTIFLLAANIATFLADMYFGMDWLDHDTDILLALGANYAPMTLTGESWRLFSSMFMHGSIQHLAINMYMLIVIGLVAERSFGRLPYLAIYLVSGAWGAVLSALWFGYHEVSGLQLIGGMILNTSGLRPVVSVGASGALMGIAGACLAARAVEHSMVETSNHVLEGTGKTIAQVLGINLVFGFVGANIDQAAHIGGVLAGAAVGGLLFAFGRAGGARRAALASVAAVVALAGAAALADRAGSEELREIRAQVEEQAREHAEATATKRRREAIETMAADDLRRMPPPVPPEVAAGIEIDLQGGQPSDFTLGPGGKRMYVTFGNDNAVKVVDMERGVLDRVIQGPQSPPDRSSGCRNNLCRGVGASGIAISNDERFAYVASMSPDALSIVDLTTDKIVASIPVGRFPRRVMLSGDGRLAFVMNGVDNSYSVIDLAARSALSPPVTLPGGSAENWPFGRALSAWMSRGGTNANFFDSLGDVVAVFDAKTRTAQADLSIGDAQALFVFPLDDRSLLLFAADRLATYDIKTGKTRVDFLNCRGTSSAWTVALSPDKKMLALSDGNQLVRLVKRETGRTIGLYPLQNPRNLAFSEDGRLVYALSAEGKLHILDVSKSMDVEKGVAERGELYCLPAD